jgi:hypothetical protein
MGTTNFNIIESPYAPFTKNDPERAAVELARNEAYVNACMAWAFAQGRVPFASHAIYTRNNHGTKVLDDTIPEERKKGMEAGFALAQALHEASLNLPPTSTFIRTFFTDRGWTNGMVDGYADAAKKGQSVERVLLGGDWGREFDADYMLNTSGKLYRWRKPEEK